MTRCMACRKRLKVSRAARPIPKFVRLEDGMYRKTGLMGVKLWNSTRYIGETADPYCDDCYDAYRALETLRA